MLANYEILGIAVIVMLIGGWTIKKTIERWKNRQYTSSFTGESANVSCRDHDADHRALIFLMEQKTDNMLAALAGTIENERQKLRVDVRNPSMPLAIDAAVEKEPLNLTSRPSRYEQILPMATSGMGIARIASQLQLPEAEVSMVLRLNAA